MSATTTIGEHKKALEGKTIRFLGHPEWTAIFYVRRYVTGPFPDSTLHLETIEDGRIDHKFTVQDSMKIEFVDDVEPDAEA